MCVEAIWSLERMAGERISKNIYNSGVEGARDRARKGRMDGLVSALSVRGLTSEQGRATGHDRPLLIGLIYGVCKDGLVSGTKLREPLGQKR